jgi:hypothetical protein
MSFGFDLTSVETEQNNRGLLPAGDYIAKIEKIELKTSKKNEANKYLNVQYKVCDMPSRNGAVFFDIVNIHNTNTDAQNIGRSRLKSMLLSSGVPEDKLGSVSQEYLVGKKVKCTLGIQKDSQYGDKNRVFQVTKADNATVESFEKDPTKQAPDWL